MTDLLDMLTEHYEVERWTATWFPADNPHRIRVICACGHTPSVESWQAHLDKYALTTEEVPR